MHVHAPIHTPTHIFFILTPNDTVSTFITAQSKNVSKYWHSHLSILKETYRQTQRQTDKQTRQAEKEREQILPITYINIERDRGRQTSRQDGQTDRDCVINQTEKNNITTNKVDHTCS